GLATAYHIKRENPESSILVLEGLGGPGQGNSAKSVGAFRNVFLSETNFLLADSSIDFFTHVQRDLEHDLGLEFHGYLWLLSERQYREQRGVFERLERRGVELRTFEKEDLHRMVPDLITDFEKGDEEAELMELTSVDKGVQGLKCGSLDADRLVRFYESEFKRLGGEVRYNTEVKRLTLKPKRELDLPGEPFVWQDARVKGVETAKGETIKADRIIVAVGAWANTLLNPIGLDAFMRPKKRQVFVFKDQRLSSLFHAQGFNKEEVIPLTILPKAGILFKPEVSEETLWLECADNLGRPFKLEDDPQPELSYYTENLYHVLVKYFPCFKDVMPVNMWAGQYALNSIDKIPYVFEEAGMIYVGAGSGSGLMKCDALGRIAAALHEGEEEAVLYGRRTFRVSDLGVKERKIERETFVL
ncbi:MAG: NAD(P)/FAD-dependent oxidoreductase, partial [Candidatus Bathyarchaeia archaeon]